MSEPYFPPPGTKPKKESAPYRAAEPVPPPPAPQIVRRPATIEAGAPPARPASSEDGVAAPAEGFVTTFLVRFAVRIAGLGLALGIVYALIWLLHDHRGAGAPVGLFLLVAVPIGLVWLLVIRIRALVGAVGRLFKSE